MKKFMTATVVLLIMAIAAVTIFVSRDALSFSLPTADERSSIEQPKSISPQPLAHYYGEHHYFGPNFMCIINYNTTAIECFGSDAHGVVSHTPTEAGFTRIDGGDTYACAYHGNNGFTYCWGSITRKPSTTQPTATPTSAPVLRDDDKTGEFHRSPVAAFEQFRVDVEKTDEGCTADPANITVITGQRIRLAVQLQSHEHGRVSYRINGLTISSSGGALGSGATNVNLALESGTRLSYDFNAASAGAFDILCDGEKIGTFTVE